MKAAAPEETQWKQADLEKVDIPDLQSGWWLGS